MVREGEGKVGCGKKENMRDFFGRAEVRKK